MLAVSNTSPISNLASIGRLEVLWLQFATIHVPEAVRRELLSHPGSGARDAIEKAIANERIVVSSIEDSALLGVLKGQLHCGEAEAIGLALQIHADVVLIDEKEARTVAKQNGLTVTGVLGVLLRAKRMGAIPSMASEIEALRTVAKFRLAELLVDQVLIEAGESPQ